MSRWSRLPLVLLCAWLACTTDLAAQVASAGTGTPERLGALRATVDDLSRAGRHGEALAAADAILSLVPDDYPLRVLAAQEGLLHSFVVADADSARNLLHRAIAHAHRAMAVEPLGEDGRYLNLAAHGRLGLVHAGPQERARLAVVVDSAARSLLAANPRHAGAQNALGRLYMEVADLNWLSKVFARRWMGRALVDRATWEAAEGHLRRAAVLEPTRNMHLLDLGILLVKRNRRDEAREILQEAVRVPLESPSQEEFREAARRLLAELGGAPTTQPGP